MATHSRLRSESGDGACRKMWDWIRDWLIGGLAWEFLLRLAAISGLLDVLAWAIAKFSFGWQPTRKQLWVFLGGFPAVVFLLLFTLASGNQQSPRFTLDWINWNTADSIGKWRNAVLVGIQVVNRGNAQSVITDATMAVTIDGQQYWGSKVTIPDNLNFPGSQITISQSDSLAEKGITPVPPGGMVRGYLLFAYPGLREKVFEGQSPEFTLKVYDAFQHASILKHIQSNEDRSRPLYAPGLANSPPVDPTSQ